MPIEITTEALLNQDYPEIIKDVDHIAMALCEALLRSARASLRSHPHDGWTYENEVGSIREELTAAKHLLHILYWFDARADYWHEKYLEGQPHEYVLILEKLLQQAGTVRMATEAALERAKRQKPSVQRALQRASATINHIVNICSHAHERHRAAIS
jgi:hypothetical protein